ncbi:MAG: D-alanyl-D-alanine carboxypeptidase family protein [Selenomonadaceae bacterium]|nr:D-alanyl-D-alanine carboxypeptidase family protein [Selenomonadaceae bacterium]
MIEYVLEPAPIDQDSLTPTNMPSSSEPFIDVEKIIPEGLTSAQNGIMPVELLTKIHCGGSLYTDAARCWFAMVRAASLDGVFLNVNRPLNAYRSIVRQRAEFLDRFVEVDPQSAAPDGAVRVEFEGKTRQLKPDKTNIAAPGQSLHGFGLAVLITNTNGIKVKNWLDDNAEQFGFVRGDQLHGAVAGDALSYVYVKSREPIPERVLEVESMPPEPSCSADQIAKAGGGKWLKMPSEAWRCSGVIASKPFRAGTLAVIDQGGGVGLSADSIRPIFRQLAGLICSSADESVERFKLPIFLSKDIKRTLNKLSTMFELEQTAEPDGDTSITSADPIELNFLKKINPEAMIFLRKKYLSERLLQIDVDDLQTAQDQPWYKEYLALLAIKLQSPPLKELAQQRCAELSSWYDKHSSEPKRELAVLCMLQFTELGNLTMSPHQNLWSEQMRADVRSVILNQITHVSYSDEEISTYYLARQGTWKHGKRKARVVFLVSCSNKNDKVMPVYRAMRERDDVEVSIVIHPGDEYHYGEKFWNYYRETFPNDTLYSMTELGDLRLLKPDYVFIQSPYDKHRQFPGFSINDIVKFAKVCHISYGATLAHTFIDRLLDEYLHFYDKVYMMFCSGETVRDKIISRLPFGTSMGYQHIEFLGYPILEDLPVLQEPNDKKRILWTPRWSMELNENFANADILLSDYSSILIVYFLTGRPIIYCEFVNAVMLPEYQEMLECMYVAHNWDEVVHYLDELVAGNDPLFERRQRAVEEIRARHEGAIRRIVDRVMADFESSSAPSAVETGAVA